jgi:hypothetical protein
LAREQCKAFRMISLLTFEGVVVIRLFEFSCCRGSEGAVILSNDF